MTPPSTPVASEAARLTVTGSGVLCGPWWMGCGAVLAVEPSEWSLPEHWAPSADDTQFETDAAPNAETTRVTGIRQAGRVRIEPGEYSLVVIETRSPDDQPQGTFDAFVRCSVNVQIRPGIRAVSVDVRFSDQSSCTIAVSMDASTPGPSR